MSVAMTVHAPYGDLLIPAGIDDLDAFRRWVRCDDFPETGRIDWFDRAMTIDISPEDINSHCSPKSAICGDLSLSIEGNERGMVYVTRTRISVPAANLSVEPDVVVVLFESIESGRVRPVPKAGGADGRYVELEGPPDLIVECVSDSSKKKDTRILLDKYERARVGEYWIVDARGETPALVTHVLGAAGRYAASEADSAGFVCSPLLGLDVRLERLPERAGLVRYRLSARSPIE